MTRGQTTTTTMLAVIAVLLGLNMLVRGSPQAGAQMTSGPAEPTVVTGAAVAVDSVKGHVVRFWSDGAVDTTPVYFNPNPTGVCGARVICDPTTIPLLPPSCPADINLDRDVGVGDMLDVFAQWGPCE